MTDAQMMQYLDERELYCQTTATVSELTALVHEIVCYEAGQSYDTSVDPGFMAYMDEHLFDDVGSTAKQVALLMGELDRHGDVLGFKFSDMVQHMFATEQAKCGSSVVE